MNGNDTTTTLTNKLENVIIIIIIGLYCYDYTFSLAERISTRLIQLSSNIKDSIIQISKMIIILG